MALNATPLVFKRGLETAAIIGISAAVAGVAGSAIASSASANANEAIAESTNEANKKAVEDTNLANIEIAEKNNQTQIQLQREMNEYNSIGAQLERGRQAGVNPNTILGGKVSGNIQTTLPNTVMPILEAFQRSPFFKENPLKDFSQNFQQIGETMSNIRESEAKTKETLSRVDINEITKRWQDKLNEMHIKVSDAQAGAFLSQMKVDYSTVRQTNENIRYIRAMAEGQRLENVDKIYRNIFSHDWYRFTVEKFKSELNYNDAMARVATTMLPVNMRLANSTANMYNSMSQYYKDLSSLTPLQKRLLSAQENLLNANGFQAWSDYSFNLMEAPVYDSMNRANAKRAWQGYASDVYNNSWVHRFSQDLFQPSVQAASAAASMYMMGGIGYKSFKSVQGVRPSASPITGFHW